MSRFATTNQVAFGITDPKGNNRLLAGTVIPEIHKPRETSALTEGHQRDPLVPESEAQAALKALTEGVPGKPVERHENPLMYTNNVAAQVMTGVASENIKYGGERSVDRRRPLQQKQSKKPRPTVTNINKLPPTIDDMPWVATDNDWKSNHVADFGHYGSNPRARLGNGRKGDLNQTATSKDMFLGTAKGSQHTPGYSGFVPGTQFNQRVLEHGLGAQPKRSSHDAMPNFNLTVAVPGYSGHLPKSALNQKVGVRQADPRTTSGAMHQDFTQ